MYIELIESRVHMINRLKLRMILGFTIVFFGILVLLIYGTTICLEEVMLYRDMNEFKSGLTYMIENVDDFSSNKFIDDARARFGGMIHVVDVNNYYDTREISKDAIDEILANLGDSKTYLHSNGSDIIYAGWLDDSTILLSFKLQSIMDEMSTMLNLFLGVASLIIFTLLLGASYFYINYFEKKMTFQAQRDILNSLGKTADAHFGETGDHIERVSYMMYRFANSIGYNRRSCEMLKIASTMHDIGKIAIPDSILKKPGRLTDEEMMVMRSHALEGKSILGDSNLPILEMAGEIAKYHHERIDGKGYPSGIKGNQIPEIARMMAIVDVYDALTHDRVYKKAMTREVALEIMISESGAQFDAYLLEVFVDNINQISMSHEEKNRKLSTRPV